MYAPRLSLEGAETEPRRHTLEITGTPGMLPDVVSLISARQITVSSMKYDAKGNSRGLATIVLTFDGDDHTLRQCMDRVDALVEVTAVRLKQSEAISAKTSAIMDWFRQRWKDLFSGLSS